MTIDSDQRCSVRTRWLVAVAIYLLALAIRGGVYYESRDWPLFTHPQIDEFTAYQIGLAFLDDRLPPEVYLKGPLYMYFVGGVAWLFGRDPMAVRLVQVFLSGLSPMLIFLIGERVFGLRVGIIAGLIGALFWTLVYYSLILVDAALTTVLYLLLLYLLVTLDDDRWWKWPVCGVVLGVGALSRPSVLAFAPVLAVMALVVVWRKNHARSEDQGQEHRSATTGLRPAVISVLALTLGCLAVVLPVTIRNRVVGGEWVLIGAYGGQNLWIANSPRSDGKSVPIYVGQGVPKVTPVEEGDVWTSISLGNRIARYYAEKDRGRRLTFGEIDAYFAEIALEYIWEHPRSVLYKTFQRFCFFLNAHEYPNDSDPYWFAEKGSRLLGVLRYAHFGVFAPVAVMGLLFVVVRRAWTVASAYLVGLLLSLWLPGLFFVINARFRVVVVAVMVPLAAYGLVQLLRLCGRGVPWSSRAAAAAALAGLAVFSNVNWFGYREPYYTDHRMAYAVACRQAGGDERLAEAVDRFERALARDVEKGELTQTAVMDHANPFGWLFHYYFQTQQEEKAFRYGSLMLERESDPVPFLLLAFAHTAMNVDKEAQARKAIETILADPSQQDPRQVILCLARFGEMAHDVAMLKTAKRMLQTLMQASPGEAQWHSLDKKLDELIARVKDSPLARPEPTTTRNGR